MLIEGGVGEWGSGEGGTQPKTNAHFVTITVVARFNPLMWHFLVNKNCNTINLCSIKLSTSLIKNETLQLNTTAFGIYLDMNLYKFM